MFILNRMTVYLNPLKGFSVGQAASNTERASPLPFLDLMTILKKYSSVQLQGRDGSSLFQVDFCSSLCKAVRRLGRREMSETSDLWQIKLVLEFFSSRSHQERLQNQPKRGLFMNSEFLPVVKCTIDNTLDQWLQGENSVAPLVLRDALGLRGFCFNLFSLVSRLSPSTIPNGCRCHVSS